MFKVAGRELCFKGLLMMMMVSCDIDLVGPELFSHMPIWYGTKYYVGTYVVGKYGVLRAIYGPSLHWMYTARHLDKSGRYV